MKRYHEIVLSKKYKKHVEIIRKKGLLQITEVREDDRALYLEVVYEDTEEMRRLTEAIFANCNTKK